MAHPIPRAALDDRLGFIGTSGSGKTYNAGVAVERLLDSGARVVIVDPLGVWFGLRLLADGKKQSDYRVAIFGGPRGDLPLTEHAGALIGETAATMAESCIIDLSELGTKSSERRFMTAFLEAIYRNATREPFHLIVDEADLFAPQKPPHGDEILLNLMEQIVRRGRVKGFIPWLISQRPAVLNKNVLSQVDGLVAFKLTSSQDRDALDAWIEGQADKAEGRAIKDQLPAMQIGQGIVWLPSHGILKAAQFPEKKTFDSSRTPKRGERVKRTATLKPLDLGALKEKLAGLEQEKKASDPKVLKANAATQATTIRNLERDLAAAQAAVLNKVNTEAMARFQEACKQAHALLQQAAARIAEHLVQIAPMLKKLHDDQAVAFKDALKKQPVPALVEGPRKGGRNPVPSQIVTRPAPPAPIHQGDGVKPTPMVRKIIDEIHRANPMALSFEAAALRAGVSRRSSAYNLYRKQLNTSDEVELRTDGKLQSAPGFAWERTPGVNPIDQFASRLMPSYASMLRVIAAATSPLSREEVAQGANISPTSSGLSAGLHELKALGLIVEDQKSYSLNPELI